MFLSAARSFGVFWYPFWHMSFSISWEPVNILSWSTYVLGIVWWSIFKKKYCISCHSLLGTVFILGCLLVYPLFLQNQLIFYHEILYRCVWYYCDSCYTKKRFFTSLSSLLRAILGVFLSPFWPKILKCSQEIEEYSYVPCFFWESFNIFSWNFLQAFLV